MNSWISNLNNIGPIFSFIVQNVHVVLNNLCMYNLVHYWYTDMYIAVILCTSSEIYAILWYSRYKPLNLCSIDYGPNETSVMSWYIVYYSNKPVKFTAS